MLLIGGWEQWPPTRPESSFRSAVSVGFPALSEALSEARGLGSEDCRLEQAAPSQLTPPKLAPTEVMLPPKGPSVPAPKSGIHPPGVCPSCLPPCSQQVSSEREEAQEVVPLGGRLKVQTVKLICVQTPALLLTSSVA